MYNHVRQWCAIPANTAYSAASKLGTGRHVELGTTLRRGSQMQCLYSMVGGCEYQIQELIT